MPGQAENMIGVADERAEHLSGGHLHNDNGSILAGRARAGQELAIWTERHPVDLRQTRLESLLFSSRHFNQLHIPATVADGQMRSVRAENRVKYVAKDR